MADDDHPYLVYSPEITIKDSSKPFQAFLGAILSVVKSVPVKHSAYNPKMELDIIEEEKDNSPLPEDDIGNGLRATFQGSSGSYPATCSRKHESTESDLIVCLFLG